MKTIEEESNEYALRNASILQEKLSTKSFTAGVEFAQKWIDVKDELPPMNIPVLVKMNYNYNFTEVEAIDVCKWNGELWINALRVQHSNGGVIFWRPIEYK